MRPIALPFTKTVLLPAANELAWVSGIDGQVCAAHPSPCRCTGLPLQNTSELPLLMAEEANNHGLCNCPLVELLLA